MWFDRAGADALLSAYTRRLRGTDAVAPVWVGEHVLAARERIPDPAAALSGEA